MDVFDSAGKLITSGAKAVLLIVTGIMTWQFLFYVMGPDKWLFAALGLVAFEAGLYAWPYLYQNDAVTTAQELIAILMTAICWAGVGIAFIGEVMRYNAGAAALLDQIQPVMPYFIMAIVILNVGAYIMFPAMSPEAANKRANKRAAFAQQKADTLLITAEAERIIEKAKQDVRDGKLNGKGNGASTGTSAQSQGGDDFLPPPADSGTPPTRGKSISRRLSDWWEQRIQHGMERDMDADMVAIMNGLIEEIRKNPPSPPPAP